jgi:hypothetical protein
MSLANNVQLDFQRAVPLEPCNASMKLFTTLVEENNKYMRTRLRKDNFYVVFTLSVIFAHDLLLQ